MTRARASQVDRLTGQVMGLVRYATKYGGITQPEVCAVLKVSTVKTNAALADLARREKVRPLPGGAWVALPPKKS